jgi:hypothetical protein
MTTRHVGRLTMAVSLSILILGCGPREMGAKAPEFGGAGKMATTAGFLEGTWKRKDDDSMVTYKAPSLGRLEPITHVRRAGWETLST